MRKAIVTVLLVVALAEVALSAPWNVELIGWEGELEAGSTVEITVEVTFTELGLYTVGAFLYPDSDRVETLLEPDVYEPGTYNLTARFTIPEDACLEPVVFYVYVAGYTVNYHLMEDGEDKPVEDLYAYPLGVTCVKRFKRQLEETVQQLEEARDALSQALERLQLLEERNRELNATVAELRGRIQQLLEEKEALASENQQIKSSLAACELQSQQLREELAAMEIYKTATFLVAGIAAALIAMLIATRRKKALAAKPV